MRLRQRTLLGLSALVLGGYSAWYLAAAPPPPATPPARVRAATVPQPRIVIPFDADWRFAKGDVPLGASHATSDASWRKLDLPHDWSIEGPFDENNPTGSAGANLPSGVAWYRKTFATPASAQGKRLFVEFDGVMANAEIYINNALVGRHAFGYTPFRLDLTDYLTSPADGPNILAVRVDTSRQPASRWYTGAGIYRHTRLLCLDPLHLQPQETLITTARMSETGATIHIQATIVNDSDKPRDLHLAAAISGPPGSAPDGAYGCAGQSPVQMIPARSSRDVAFDVDMPWKPRLWDIDHPDLHHALVRLFDGDRVVDGESLPFGIRTAEFKPDTGFWLNGKNIKLQGVCLHHDAGGLGAAVPASAWESRLTALKKMGANAIRTAHNPPSTELLDACDRLGLLVMDEAFDVWSVGKEPADYHLYFKDHWREDLEAMMTRDRNHPSIVIWSLGNEIWDILPQNPDPAPDQFKGPPRSIEIAKNILTAMKELAHQLDPTRPITVAEMRPNVAHAYDNGFADLMDVIGQNYRENELAAAHRQNPQRKIIGTENYKTRDSWLAMRDNPAFSGQFLWAGVDYLGEAGKWPNVVSPSGLFDRTNQPKGEALEHEAWWVHDRPVLHVVRMQSVPARPGRPPVSMGFANWTPADLTPHAETVAAYSNCEEVELFLNDTSLGSKGKDPRDAPRQWQVPFAAGTLRAIAKNGGAIVAQQELKTAGPPAKILLQPERSALPNDWDDVCYVRATIVDAKGIPTPNAAAAITFRLAGPAEIAAVDNGALADHDSFRGDTRKTFQGSCVAILRATADAGRITLTASAENLADGAVDLQAAPPMHR
jgi:beta-galactosidase